MQKEDPTNKSLAAAAGAVAAVLVNITCDVIELSGKRKVPEGVRKFASLIGGAAGTAATKKMLD